MYHVNGYAADGKIVYVWPFVYKNTNLGFTRGFDYGNRSIMKSEKQYEPLLKATQRILDCFNCPDHLIFHCELFENKNDFLLCEIAARKPGGSIGHLIDLLEGGGNNFSEIEFRLYNGLV
jgi:hypothetical protein